MPGQLLQSWIRHAPSPNSGPCGARALIALTRRDIAYGGGYAIRDHVTRYDQPVTCPVRLCDRKSGVLLREMWSDPTTGAYAFEGLDPAGDYLIYALDPARAAKPDINDQLTLIL